MRVTVSMSSTLETDVSASARSTIRAVAMPTEHGGWSLTLEPAILGLIVAWSWRGFALGVAGMIAFLVRTPLKIVLVDWWRKRWLHRTNVALQVAVVELTLLIVFVGLGTVGADQRLWIPVIFAVPLIGIELWFDMRSKSRRLLPELAGTVGIGALAATIALANGTSMKISLGLWAVIAARAVAAIPYVRTQILRRKGKIVQLWHSDLAQVVSIVSVLVSLYAGLTVGICVAIISFVAAFNLTAVRFPTPPTKVIGIQQMFIGIGVVVGTGIAVLN